jgi:hypothetical protein
MLQNELAVKLLFVGRVLPLVMTVYRPVVVFPESGVVRGIGHS